MPLKNWAFVVLKCIFDLQISGNIMAASSKRATVYFDPGNCKTLKLKSLETSRSISELVHSAVKQAFADGAEAIIAYGKRKNEAVVSFSEMVKRLKNDALISDLFQPFVR